MSEVQPQNCNLNIWYSLPEELWGNVTGVYKSMPGWLGFKDGIPYWFGREEDNIFIWASVEPSGLSFYARMGDDEWSDWMEKFKLEATKAVGFEVGEPEDGFL
ncbi:MULTISPECIES: hypothetical protein [Sporosarcina]|uniref:hypothetical protein n=1 Tax=Sporosarcina TaxID=1569 RepID=UPI0018914AE0|nr:MULTISPECIES: hypothetical protein [Sporosarcina]GKV65575.1 hypothetical protein NCCP2331_17280 [Sporosarcina sp. NCCP-2331]GLB55700.1 hypothetical protein NCCP2378_14870 [Sporosarcina sp. NCCP-2378]